MIQSASELLVQLVSDFKRNQESTASPPQAVVFQSLGQSLSHVIPVSFTTFVVMHHFSGDGSNISPPTLS